MRVFCYEVIYLLNLVMLHRIALASSAQQVRALVGRPTMMQSERLLEAISAALLLVNAEVSSADVDERVLD